MVRHFSKLEVDNLNLQLKCQHLEEKVKLANAKTSSDAPEFDAHFELAKRDEKIQAHTNTIRNLKNIIARLKDDAYKSNVIETQKPPSIDSQNFQMQNIIDHLRLENECFQAENSKVKQHYKELYDSIKPIREQNKEKETTLLKEIENLKTQVKGKMPVDCVNIPSCASKCNKYACDSVYIPLPLRNNALAHREYLKHLKDCLDMLRETVEENRMVRPDDSTITDACFLSHRSQELLDYAIGTSPKITSMQDKPVESSSRIKYKHVTFSVPLTASAHDTPITRKQTTGPPSNVPIINSTGVNIDTKASGSKPRCNTRNDRTSPAKSAQGKKVEDHSRNNKIVENVLNRVDSSISYKRTVINSNSIATCKTCNECLISGNHDECVKAFLKSCKSHPVNVAVKRKLAKPVWKPTGKEFTTVGYQWRPTGRKFTLGQKCPLTVLTYVKLANVKVWRATGRKFPLVTQSSDNRSPEVISNNVIDNSNACAKSVSPEYVCANQLDPNCTWGSTFFSYPYLSGFKCRSYKSSCGIWTQAAQNI